MGLFSVRAPPIFGAHVVVHSYGGLGAMFAAAQRPEATHSLSLLEPPAFTMTSDNDAAGLVDAVRASGTKTSPTRFGSSAFSKRSCDELAEQIDAARGVVEGAGHEIQFTGAPINDALLNLWGSTE